MVAAVQANPMIKRLDLRDVHGGFDTSAFATLQCDVSTQLRLVGFPVTTADRSTRSRRHREW